MSASIEIYKNLRRLYASLKPKRKTQLKILLGLMLCASVGEVANIGALFPLIALFVAPETSLQKPIVRDIFQLLGPSAQADPAWTATLLFITATVVAVSIRLLLLYVSGRLTSVIAHEFAAEVFRRTLFQPYSVHIAQNSASVLSSIPKVDEVSGVLYTLANTVSAIFISIFILGTVVWISPLFAGATLLIFGTIYVIFAAATRSRISNNSKNINIGYTQRLKTFQESLGGIRDILLDHTQSIFVQKFSKLDYDMRRAYTENLLYPPSTRFLAETTGMILIAILGYWMTRTHGSAETFSTLSAIAFGAQRVLPMAQQIYHGYTVIQGSQHSVSDVLFFLHQPIEQYSAHPKAVDFQREIKLERVCFGYGPNAPFVLDNVDLSIRHGGRIGFIGATGSGKSTLVDVIMGLLEPTSGRILVDGVSITEREARLGWQRKIAHVPQDIYLIDGSISDNIAFGVATDEIDLQRVRQVARDAQIADFIETLPQGYESHVGERGVRLSGGQKQRIGIARALYKRPAVLVLDEATSALDSETEASVMETIYTLRRDLTLLMIAHRTTTLAGCDVVYRLESGKAATEAVL
jgi:ABC-type multidrug transport system fused ATPase/permease subunit